MTQRENTRAIGTGPRRRCLVSTAGASDVRLPTNRARNRRRTYAAIAALGLAGVAACTGSSSSPRSSTSGVTNASTTVTTSSVTSPTLTKPLASSRTTTSAARTTPPKVSPEVKAAELAYAKFNAAYHLSEKKPRKLGQPWPRGGDVTEYSFVPFSTSSALDVLFLSHNGLVYRGTPPKSRVLLVKVTASPRQVVLSDCPTAPANWQTYNVSNGKIAPIQKPKVPEPYEVRVVMTYQQGHWGVLSGKADTTRTCHR